MQVNLGTAICLCNQFSLGLLSFPREDSFSLLEGMGLIASVPIARQGKCADFH